MPSKAHFTLAQMARFHFSKCLNHHPIIYSKPFFIDLSINGHFGCFCDLTVVNNAAVEEYIYLFVFVFFNWNIVDIVVFQVYSK